MRTFIISLLFAAFCTNSIAQTGTIKGMITTSDGKPVESVSVFLKDTKYITVTDKDGIYQLKNIPANTYMLLSMLTEIQTQSKKITIKDSETLLINFTLTESETELKEVIVTARRTMNEKQVTIGKAGYIILILKEYLCSTITIIVMILVHK